MKVSWIKCRKRIATVWLIGAGGLFALLIGQTFFGKFGEHPEQAWEWFLPSIMPTLSLIIGVLISEQVTHLNDKKQVGRFVYRLSIGLSIGYLLLLYATLLIQPFTNSGILELMNLSNLWLGPFQGLVSASLGVFYVQNSE